VISKRLGKFGRIVQVVTALRLWEVKPRSKQSDSLQIRSGAFSEVDQIENGGVFKVVQQAVKP
jgi:hypothetical protein